MRSLRRVVPFVALLAALAVLGACGDDAPSGTTLGVVFGEGELPESVPDDFPIPPGSEVGSTLVDKINNRTEFTLTLRSDPTSAVQFFQVGLVNQGYVVESSEGNQALWEMTYSKGQDITGSIVFTAPRDDLVAAVVRVSTS